MAPKDDMMKLMGIKQGKKKTHQRIPEEISLYGPQPRSFYSSSSIKKAERRSGNKVTVV